MKYSLILPVYNVAPFLDDCINSLMNQYEMTLGIDYEIIFVNDGSTDNSLDIILNYQANHSLRQPQGGGYLVENQLNSGVSIARNKGLSLAKGDFVWFIDPDDFIAPNSLKLIDEQITKNNAAILNIKKKYVDELQPYNEEAALKLQKSDAFQQSANTAVNYVIRRDYLRNNDISFKEGMTYGEDTLWCFWVNFYNCQPIFQVQPALYFYRQRSGSSMHSKSHDSRIKHLDSMLMMLDTYTEVYKFGKITTEQKKHLKSRIDWSVQNVCMDAIRLSKDECNKIVRYLADQGLYPYQFNRNRYSVKYGLKNFAINVFACLLKYKWYLRLANSLLNK